MSKKFFFIALGLLVAGLTAWLLFMNQKEFIPGFTDAEISERLEEKRGVAPAVPVAAVERIGWSRPVRLAIGPIGLGDEQQSLRTSDLVLAQLAGARGFDLVERQALDAVLREQGLSTAGLVRAKDAVRVGQLLRADWFLLGGSLSVNGTNFAVVRIVDTRTGVLREAGVFQNSTSATQLASELADFVRRCRQHASEAKSPVFLAIGSFEDLSLNNRQPALPAQLRSYLTAAYQKSHLTLLEREFASALFREMQLDLAGLTDESAANTAPMQSAYWMVDGYYQSYETSQFEVELVLNVRRMFGKTRHVSLREKPGEPLFKRVKEGLDGVMAQDQAALFPSRLTELRMQLSVGEELLQSMKPALSPSVSGSWLHYTGQMTDSEVARHRRNIAEAIRAFETALLLDPTNRQARAGLAACLSAPYVGRFDEARDLYRQLIDTPIADQWTRTAQGELVWSFRRFVGPDEKRRWFAAAVERSSNPAATIFFEQQLRAAVEDMALANPGTAEAERIAEERLLRAMELWDADVRKRTFVVDFDNTGLGKYVEAFGTNTALAARKLVALLPKLQAASTNLAPHIFAGVVTFQVDTNAPIIAELERALDEFAEHPPRTSELRYYVQLLASPVYRWAENKRLYHLAVKLKEIDLETAGRERGMPVSEDEHLELGFNYLQAALWQKALDIFQSHSNRPVQMSRSGMWGRAFTVVLPGKEAAACRQKLGLPPVKDPREFEMRDPWMCLHEPTNAHRGEPTMFAAGADGLWIATGDHLMQVGFDSQTNVTIRLPNDFAPVTCITVGDSALWIGTFGAGLIEIEKSTRKCLQLTEKDGLLMNEITSLHLAGDSLWIGCGNKTRGGLGRLDLPARRFVSFMPSLGPSVKPQPPGAPVGTILSTLEGGIWFLAKSQLGRHRFDLETWEYFENRHSVLVRSLAADETRLIKGLRIPLTVATLERRPSTNGPDSTPQRTTQVLPYEEFARLQQALRTNRTGPRIVESSSGNRERGGLALHSLPDSQSRRLLEPEGLPHAPSAMALDGRHLWVGGLGYVALVDLDENKILKIAYVPTRTVDQIQISGSYVWAQFDRHLYRVPF